jgi:eukaryotic-like serine/threonine-protein kinase
MGPIMAPMALTPGTKLGPYEILTALGAGGMGEVYRARDTRLGRDVAIKVLPSHLSADPDLKARFEREAKAISSLNHPHICTLHDVGYQDGIDFLVMELLEGETLADRLQKGTLPLKQALEYGIEIAGALEKAHKSGIMHRDLKPGNIMLTKSGAKLMDFGLAKPTASLTAMASGSVATMSKPLTGEGKIVGTFQYMAPEQIRGENSDARTDIFAFGAVLYQMVTGKRAFAGQTQISVMSAILEKEPSPITAVKPMTPLALDHAIRKCLAKLPDDRWQSASDLASELKWIGESGTHAAVGAVARPRLANQFKEKLAWVIAGALLAILAVAAIWWWNPKPTDRTLYFHDPFPSAAQDIAIAPNGHTLALVAYLESARKGALWVHEVGTLDAKWFGDTAGARFPFWSADGKSIGFFADSKLKKLDLSSGQVQTICDAPSGRGGTWNKDGVIVFTPDASAGIGLHRVSASGGTATPISKLDTNRGELSHRWPMFLPDDNHFLYMAANFASRKGADAIFVGSLDSSEKRLVTAADSNAAYAAPYLLFYRERALLAQRFDLRRFELTGEAGVLLTDVQYQPQIKRLVFAVSDGGLLVAQTGSGVALSNRSGMTVKAKKLAQWATPVYMGT